jgi:hypothetical protein
LSEKRHNSSSLELRNFFWRSVLLHHFRLKISAIQIYNFFNYYLLFYMICVILWAVIFNKIYINTFSLFIFYINDERFDSNSNQCQILQFYFILHKLTNVNCWKCLYYCNYIYIIVQYKFCKTDTYAWIIRYTFGKYDLFKFYLYLYVLYFLIKLTNLYIRSIWAIMNFDLYKLNWLPIIIWLNWVVCIKKISDSNAKIWAPHQLEWPTGADLRTTL